VALARLLHHDVDVLLLDEPTRGIDVASKAQIYRLIDTLVSSQRADAERESSQRADAERESSQRADAERESERPDAQEEPRAVLMISSYLPELLGLCDRVTVMCRGRLGPPRPVGELTEHSLMLEATGAGDA
jgi:ribose transport system ATP-binding protein